MNKKISRFLGCLLGGVTLFSAFTGCAPQAVKDSIVLMTEEMSGLFNPFYATSGADMDVVGMTQIGMLSTDGQGKTVAGDDQPCVVKSYAVETKGTGNDERTEYTFVLKNGLKFSDGTPLTMNDVLFNMYELLDPVYTGSSTMYSIDILGLSEYRTQEYTGEDINKYATTLAQARIDTLSNVYMQLAVGQGTTVKELSDTDIRNAILSCPAGLISDMYKNAVLTGDEQKELQQKGVTAELEFYRTQLMKDYDFAKATFLKELHSDFRAAKESFDTTTKPYSADHIKPIFDADTSGVFRFFLYERYITPEYEYIPGTSRPDTENIKNFGSYEDYTDRYTTEDAAVERVFTDKMYTYNTTQNGLDKVLSVWGTAGTMQTKFAADAMDVLLHDAVQGDSMKFPFIYGIDSLGHTQARELELEEESPFDITPDPDRVEFVDATTQQPVSYKVAKEHNEDGTPKNDGEYDVLRITIKGVDPKAIYNFGFTVAPVHYYGSANGTGNDVDIDIENNKFGVKWADSEFQSKVIQSQRNVEVPMGAGAFMATNAANTDDPTGAEFWNSNVVYFKANENFLMGKPKAEKLRLQVVSPSNAIDKLANNEVDYITPQLTTTNSDRLTRMEKDGYVNTSSWQLGYGYIGINAGKIPDINVRKAIMAAMNVESATEYYDAGKCIPIQWPMSKVSWAYPKANEKDVLSADDDYFDNDDLDYMIWDGREAAKTKITTYVPTPPATEIRFTIAGASITEHPTYKVFQEAAEILRECGWKVDVKADSQALTKLATGSLSVWAAAWGSTIDPDMYQVYHKNSTATSVFAWGYREIKAAGSSVYPTETRLMNELSDLIEQARETDVQATRKGLYKQAMTKVLEMAVEMPVYQRQTLYAYNSNTVKGFVEVGDNPYSSPLERIWELELVK